MESVREAIFDLRINRLLGTVRDSRVSLSTKGIWPSYVPASIAPFIYALWYHSRAGMASRVRAEINVAILWDRQNVTIII